MNICTIIAKNYVAHARVLAESFRALHPDGTCSVLIVDDFADCIDPREEPFEVVEIDQIGLPDPEQMAASYDVVEFSTAVKPWLLRHLLERPGVDAVTYLDPDIWIAGSLEEVDRRARRHGIVLTPHFTAPLPRDGLKPSDEDILIAGAYNLGFIALGAGDAAQALLDWWAERLERDCVIDPERGRFVDQRWIDLAPGLWPDLHILRDSGFNLAYWNLPARRFEHDGEDRYLVDGRPLRFFHFSGFDPLAPAELSRHQNRVEVSRSPALSRICSAYAEELLEHGHREAKAWPYGWDVLPNGVRLDRPARHLHREAVEAAGIEGSVFSRRGAKRFVGYLTEADSGGVTRYARAVWDSRADLRHAFPDIDGRDAPRFADWMHEHAAELRISEPLLPSRPAMAAAAVKSAENGGARRAAGVNLAGYLSSELGVGEAARQIHSALEAGDVATATIDIPVEPSRMRQELGRLDGADLPFGFNLICVNADMLPELAGAAGPMLEDRYSAGLWFWEISQFPQRWLGSFDHVDEVWVASEHVADALRPVAPVPVTTVRVPVAPALPAKLSREELGMPDGFCFLFVFDYRSVFRRKNPLGAVEAFGKAFAPGSGPSLVVKSVSGDAFPAAAAALAAAAAEHPDIRLIEETVEPGVKNAMIESCDCYVSLHRSEGLGLTMAEAMYFGRPVIATSYSGNLDFMTRENSYLVDHAIGRIGADADPYPADGEWAEPDLDHAARLMREVFEDQRRAAERGQRAAADIRRTHSPQAAGRLLAERVAEVRRQQVLARFDPPPAADSGAGKGGEAASTALVALGPAPVGPAGDPTSGRAQLHHLLRFDEPPPRRGSGRLRTAAKRLYMRALRPYSSHQHRLSRSTAEAIDELGTLLTQMEGRAARADEATRSQLEDELAALRGSLAAAEADLRQALDLPQIVEKRTAALRESLDEVGDDLAEAVARWEAGEAAAAGLAQEHSEREAEARAAIEAVGAQARTAIDAVGGEARAAVEAVGAELGATREKLELLSGDFATTLDRDRAFVDALRSSQERFAAMTEAALADLQGQAAEAAEFVQAAKAKPFMADERFAPRAHPRLGSVIGFTGGPAEETSDTDGYRSFEDLFRGPEEMIRERQRVYLDVVAGFAPVLDAGCGRGEFLDLLTERGVECRGVDLDPGMVARCREKGHEHVKQGDLLEHLEEAAPDSLGTVFSAQVVEHLDPDRLQRMLELSLSRLRPGGLFIAETVNPHSAAALKAFWVDPTHRRPLFPETMLALCQLTGYAAADVFSPLGCGDWEVDRLNTGEYGIVAVAPERGA